MKKPLFVLPVILLLMLLPLISGCAPKEMTSKKQTTITDSLSRTVEVPAEVNSAIALGGGALRLYLYVADPDKIVGVEEMESSFSPYGESAKKYAVTYAMANPDLAKLPKIGAGGNDPPDPERILSINPDVIFISAYSCDTASADALQAKTGIPVIVVSYGTQEIFDETLYQSLLLIGEVMGNSKQAETLVSYIKDAETDLKKRAESLTNPAKPSVYAGAIAYGAILGIESTRGNYALFTSVDAKNVVDSTGTSGSIMIDREQLLQWNPDKIFIDYSGVSVIREDIKNHPDYYEVLSPFQNNQVYLTLPYISYAANVETAIADCYYVGSVLYPDAFKDIDPAKKAGEIYEAFLGVNVYDQMVENYGPFMQMQF